MVRPLDNKTLAILGPTASGKSNLSLALAQKIKGEILNCDSVQVYKGFDIGSAKASEEERKQVPHHLFDLVSWDESFDAAMYRTKALECIAQVLERKHTPILTGGTGLYFRALCGVKFHDLPSDTSLRKKLDALNNEELYVKLMELDPQRARELHQNDRFRLRRACEIILLTGQSFSSLENNEEMINKPFTILCKPPKEDLLSKIEQRSQQMIQSGLIEEVQFLLNSGCPEYAKPMQSIGYLQVCEYLKHKTSKEELLEKIIIATRQYARKQLKWFRQVPVDLVLENPYDVDSCVKEIVKHLKS